MHFPHDVELTAAARTARVLFLTGGFFLTLLSYLRPRLTQRYSRVLVVPMGRALPPQKQAGYDTHERAQETVFVLHLRTEQA